LLGPRSTFQQTIARVSDSALFDRPIVVTNAQYRFLVAEQLAEIGAEADILLEPERRDSGPAIAAGALLAQRRENGCVVLALAADHIIGGADAFVEACRSAQPVAEEGYIVTFGVRPTHPASEYGYVKPGAVLKNGTFVVDRFVEKPDRPTAERYVADGYLWNSGNFMFRADMILREYQTFEPESFASVERAVEGATTDLGFIIADQAAFASAKAISIDYAVMEKTKQAAVLPVSFDWSDFGSWHSAWQLSPKDQAENASRENALFVDSRNCYVSSDKAMVTLLGVEDLVVIAEQDAILVANRERASDLKQLVSRVKEEAPELTREHLKVYRPWGSYQSLELGNGYQVKRIIVKPANRLSLQLHNHRAEHWVVVRGTARITVGNEVKMLHKNESTYIPMGVRHRLENPGKIDLELIEVQSGDYLGEDDIERFDDDYHRT
jgi:mannose-1-phosphate guanylyltransferase/mannose-6-phosphate isomerase